MPRDPSHIFLSGASGDFKQVRLEMNEALQRGLCKVTHQDSFPQTASDTLLKLAQLIDPCGITVHMVGRNPGSIPEPEVLAQYLATVDSDGKFLAAYPKLRTTLGDFSGITYTQWEAYIALHLGIPLLVYADATSDSPAHPQRQHLDRLREIGRYSSLHLDEAALHRMVMADLMAHFRINPATAQIPAILKPSNLPGGYIGQLFLGRDEFLETIHQSLQGGKHAPAITQKHAATGISGLGGIGKTHAAVEYANRHRDEYTALLFVSGDTPEKLHSSLANLCSVLRLDENGSLLPEESVRVRAALDWLSTHPDWLLIIDNVDDEPAALALTEILGQLTAGHLLITSRLQHWPNQIKPLDLKVISENDSTDLLLQLTENRRRVTPDDRLHAHQLAKLLDGLPLAIHQAAGYIREQRLTFADYLTRYAEEASDLLNWFNDLTIPYERPDKIAPHPVLITWKTSFDKLRPEDKCWLLVFSHFCPDPIPEFLLEPKKDSTPGERNLVRAAADSIARIENYSLLTRSHRENVFMIHRLVQQVTRIYFPPDDCQSVLKIGISLMHSVELGAPDNPDSWSKWDLLYQHGVSICSFSADTSEPKALVWLLHELGAYFFAKALFNEAEKYFLRALGISRVCYGGEHRVTASSVNNLGAMYLEIDRLTEAEPLLRESLRLQRLEFGDDHPEVAIALNNLAQLFQATKRFSEAEPLMLEALEIDRSPPGK